MLLAVTVIVGLAVPAATAATSPAKLSAQVKSLQKQVTALKKQVKKVNTALGQTESVAIVALLYGGCNTAVTADALQGGNPTAFGNAPVSDYNACSLLQQATRITPTIVRQPNVPTVNVFQELLNVFKP
jgi:uncharacterized protein (DUF1501 family)